MSLFPVREVSGIIMSSEWARYIERELNVTIKRDERRMMSL